MVGDLWSTGTSCLPMSYVSYTMTSSATDTYSFNNCVYDGTTLPHATWQFGVWPQRVKLLAGERSIELPDGATLEIDDLGNYHIDDKHAKVVYQAHRMREFSPHLNASDMLAQFVTYVGSLGVKRAEVMSLPIHLFVSWLIIEAAQRDGDEIPIDVTPVADDPIVKSIKKPKCLLCGRFIRRIHAQHRFLFCSPAHGSLYLEKLGERAEPEKMLA